MKISVLVSVVFGWGRVGHEVIGDIASAFLTQESRKQIAKLVGPQFNIRYLSNWADEVKSYPKYDWSTGLHFVNINYYRVRNPELDEQLDCPDGKCIVRAIADYTRQSNCRFPTTDLRREAFKFLIHFIGETAQPLHVCGREKGGSTTRIIIDGKPNNLHYIWDTVIIDKRIKTFFGNNDGAYAQFLVNSITTGQYKNVANTWLSRQEAASTSQLGNSLVAIDWVKDTAGVRGSNCYYVWNEYGINRQQDFGKKYCTDNMHVVDLQLAKAGYRLAHHLNQIFKDCL